MATNGATSSTEKDPGAKHIQFESAHLCKTTGWYNNCGLNSLTHFMYAKLSAIPESDFDVFLLHNPEYFELLETFKRYYNLNNAMGWQDILRLLREYPVPTDKEAIFAPVLRAHLGKVLAENAGVLWDRDASGAISDFMTRGQVADVAMPIYYSNKVFFDKLRADFEVAFKATLATHATHEEIGLARASLIEKYLNPRNKKEGEKIDVNYQPEGIDILEYVIFKRRTKLEGDYFGVAQDNWLQQGCELYADYMGNMNNQVMVSADHLQFLAKQFNIGVEVYTAASLQAARADEELAAYTHGAQLMPRREHLWVMKALNDGFHWTFLNPDNNLSATTEHNRHYEEAGRTVEMLGKFKILSALPMSKEFIYADVRCFFGEISADKVGHFRQFELLATAFANVPTNAVEAALKLSSPTLVVAQAKPGIKLATLAIMQQNESAKQMIESIEKTPDVLAAFNQYSSENVKFFAFALFCSAPSNLAGLMKFTAEQLLDFVQRYKQKLDAIIVQVKPSF